MWYRSQENKLSVKHDKDNNTVRTVIIKNGINLTLF